MDNNAAKKELHKLTKISVSKRTEAQTARVQQLRAVIAGEVPEVVATAAAADDTKTAKTPEEQREAKRAALSAWRKAHPERVRAYMKEWRKNRTEKEAGSRPGEVATTKRKPAPKRTVAGPQKLARKAAR